MPSPDASALALASIKASHAGDRLAHAYLIVGSPRAEGLEFARAMAQLVLCKDLAPPCGSCIDCRHVVERLHPDIVWLEPEKKSRIIAIDPVREACKLLAQKSYGGGWKLAILLHADRLSPDGANAFLKTLEEPPPRTLILLVTAAPQALLATIISRCQRIQLGGADRPVEAHWSGPLLDLLAAPLGSGVVDRMARGRQLQALLDVERKRIEKEVEAEQKESDEEIKPDVFDARIESQARQIRADMLQTMLLWYRDVMLIAGGGDARLLHFPAREADLRRLVAVSSLDAAARGLRGLEALIRRLDRNIKPEGVAYEALLLDSEK